MRKKFFTFLFMVMSITVYSQVSEPRPDWARQIPNPPKGANFAYFVGMGEGETEQEAELKAWKNGLYKAFNEGGLVGIPAQSTTLDKIYSMNDLEIGIPMNVLPRRLVCQTLPLFNSSNNSVKVYVLLQVKLVGSEPTDFYNYDISIECESSDFREELENWNANEISQKKSKEIEIQKAKKKEKRRIDRMNQSFFTNGHKNYMSWQIIDVNYPFSFSSSFSGRYGFNGELVDFMGIGVELSGGIGGAEHVMFKYSLGIRVYIYKTLYVKSSYGQWSSEKAESFNHQDGRFSIDGSRNVRGFSYNLGYDYITESLIQNYAISLTFYGGVLKDSFTKKISPSFGIGFGMTWGL